MEAVGREEAAVVREAAASVKGDITIDTARAPRSWSLDGDRIREVVINLVDNGVSAGEPVRVEVYVQDRKLVIEVSDNGVGIDPEDLEGVFRYKVRGTGMERTEGSGLGLAIAREAAEQTGLADADAE